MDVLNEWAQFPLRAADAGPGAPHPGERRSAVRARVAERVHAGLQRTGGVRPPREFVLMDRSAIGLGSVFLRLRAELNWSACSTSWSRTSKWRRWPHGRRGRSPRRWCPRRGKIGRQLGFPLRDLRFGRGTWPPHCGAPPLAQSRRLAQALGLRKEPASFRILAALCSVSERKRRNAPCGAEGKARGRDARCSDARDGEEADRAGPHGRDRNRRRTQRGDSGCRLRSRRSRNRARTRRRR